MGAFNHIFPVLQGILIGVGAGSSFSMGMGVRLIGVPGISP